MFRFREVKLSDAARILSWRRKERVTRFMHSDVAPNLEAHEKWLVHCFDRPDYYHWVVQYSGRDIGLINFMNYNPSQRNTSWGFYIGEDGLLGIGGLVPPFFYNFVFDALGVECVKANVFYNNLETIQLHLNQGYTFAPTGNYVITKNGEEILVVHLELRKEMFEKSRYKKFKAHFPLEKWQHKDQIKA